MKNREDRESEPSEGRLLGDPSYAMDPKPHYHISTETVIDPQDASEIRRWSDELGVPEEQVREAIRLAGTRFGDVEQALSRRFSEEHEEEAPGEGGPRHAEPAEEGGKVDETRTE